MRTLISKTINFILFLDFELLKIYFQNKLKEDEFLQCVITNKNHFHFDIIKDLNYGKKVYLENAKDEENLELVHCYCIRFKLFPKNHYYSENRFTQITLDIDPFFLTLILLACFIIYKVTLI